MAGGPEPILLYILLIIVGAKIGGELAERVKQPAVLGELLVGVLLGGALLGGMIGMPDFGMEQEFHHEEELVHEAEAHLADARDTGTNVSAAEQDLELAEERFGAYMAEHGPAVTALEILAALAMIGVILLLFEVGLESDIKELTKVGASSMLVGLIGIVGSFGLGYGFSYFLSGYWDAWSSLGSQLPDNLLHIFVGATLTATSVGITARVLGDMGKLNTKESRIILGAAVIDDIGGLIILAIVAAMIDAALTGGAVAATDILKIAALAVGFLVVSLVVGLKFVPPLYDKLVESFQVKGFPVALAIAFALTMAYLATVFGLADIVGAFAGGLILAQTKHAHRIFEDLRPIAAIFVSFFFVTLGMRVDVSDLGPNAALMLGAAVVLTILAMAAKLACGWGVTKGTDASKLVVGVGMSPRGEVGLIFAALGLSAGLIANWQYTMVIIVVMLTTFVTPIWLKRLQGSFRNGAGPPGKKAEGLSQIMEV